MTLDAAVTKLVRVLSCQADEGVGIPALIDSEFPILGAGKTPLRSSLSASVDLMAFVDRLPDIVGLGQVEEGLKAALGGSYSTPLA